MAAVMVDQVSIWFDELEALQEVSFTVQEGEFVSLLGPSGCGKTTLLNIIADILEPTGGKVRVNSDSPSTARKQRAIGYVFQSPALLKNRTALANVRLPMEIACVEAKEADMRSRQALELVGLHQFGEYYPHQLSGGMRQRVAIARVFASNYKLLLMDEPFGALDTHTRERMGEELLRIWEQAGQEKTIIFVTHDHREAAFLSDRVIFLTNRPGRVLTNMEVSFERPRVPDLRTSEAFFRLTNKLWKLYQKEAP